jgi:hypothetical protein
MVDFCDRLKRLIILSWLGCFGLGSAVKWVSELMGCGDGVRLRSPLDIGFRNLAIEIAATGAKSAYAD